MHGFVTKILSQSCILQQLLRSSLNILHVLHISDGPMFKPLAEDGSADPGDSIMLSCVVSSNPPAMVVWRKKGETRVLSGNATFVIPKVTENDFGLYTCTASLLNYEEISQDIRLIRKGFTATQLFDVLTYLCISNSLCQLFCKYY